MAYSGVRSFRVVPKHADCLHPDGSLSLNQLSLGVSQGGWNMKRHDFTVVLCAALVSLASGCVGSPEDTEGAVGEALGAYIIKNSLLPESLTGALTPAMLGQAALATGSLSSAARAALRDPGASGEAARQLLSYTVGCALTTSQSVSVIWVDSDFVFHVETYRGLLGLAPAWATGPLNATSSQRWVSACLAARVNKYGVAVDISLHGAADGLGTTADEGAAYPMLEGAFWGNLFTSSPALFACDDPAGDDNARSASRVCAAGVLDGSGTLTGCENIQRVGSCTNACGDIGAAGYYAGCSPAQGQGTWSQIVTVHLQ